MSSEAISVLLFLSSLLSFSFPRIHYVTVKERNHRQRKRSRKRKRNNVAEAWRMKSSRWERNQTVLLAPPARSLIMFLWVRKGRGGTVEDGTGADWRAGKKRRAIIPQLLEISVSINLVSPWPRRRRCFALLRPGWFFPVHRFRARATDACAYAYTRMCTYEIEESFEFRPIDDELIVAVIKADWHRYGWPDTVFITINDVNAMSISVTGICQLT